jgi:putative DNA primase/helicase
MSSTRTVSQILLDDRSIKLRPGMSGGECPACHSKTFSIKAGDLFGKCFHPACGHIIRSAEDGAPQHSLSTVLAQVAKECHAELMRLKTLPPPQKNAYTYLHDERNVHPRVIEEAMLGAVPAQYNVRPYFDAAIDEATKAFDAIKALGKARLSKKEQQQQERLEQRLASLKEDQGNLGHILEKYVGWLVFVYTDASHRPVSLRLRDPYTKHFVSFKPGIMGVFGHELFTPFQSKSYQEDNDHVLVVEGEFNVLQLQSLACRFGEAIKQTAYYVHACAVGAVTVADVQTVGRFAKHAVVCYDHDAHGAGFELVKRFQDAMKVSAFTTPTVDSDLDSYIEDFGTKATLAWKSVHDLIKKQEPYGREYKLTGEEFFDYPVVKSSRGEKVFVPKLLGDALIDRQTYKYTASLLWVYRKGVYRPDGEAVLLGDAQALLGKESRSDRLNEALRYTEIATRLSEDPPPERQFLNLLSGRLEMKTRQHLGHTADIFTTVQLPVDFDPAALCPAFDNYLATTFDADVIPLIHEILGWCLLPDTRFETAVMLIGEGENGKSVFLDLLGYLLGEENTSNVALQDLEENRFKAAQLYGKLANIFADLDSRALVSSSMFKTLVTGDPIDAERKHCDPFTFRSYAKLLFSANKMPSSRDKSHAFYRRWLMIPFTRIFDGKNGNPKPDKELRDKLKKELPGILNHALAGLDRLNANGDFTKPQSVEDTKQAYMIDNDNVRAFLAECVVAEKDGTIVKKTFRDVYQHWCDDYGQRPVGDKALKDALQRFVPNLDEYRKEKYDPWSWLGIAWTDDAAQYLCRDEQNSHRERPGGGSESAAERDFDDDFASKYPKR